MMGRLVLPIVQPDLFRPVVIDKRDNNPAARGHSSAAGVRATGMAPSEAERMEPYRPPTGCQSTERGTREHPCTEWIGELARQSEQVAGGGAVAGRVAGAGPLAARSVSERAGESVAGVHRYFIGDPAHVDDHRCRCGHHWPIEWPAP